MSCTDKCYDTCVCGNEEIRRAIIRDKEREIKRMGFKIGDRVNWRPRVSWKLKKEINPGTITKFIEGLIRIDLDDGSNITAYANDCDLIGDVDLSFIDKILGEYKRLNGQVS